ncbi:AAA family ATPase [Olegusella massiliensis]|uniref:AAA family ATPase n=1 Tax=Olegusella massiliensis TaxID=1776381 RepID=UPI0040555788
MNDHKDLLDALAAIPVQRLSYQEWVSCGMALKKCGFTLGDWQAWSSLDTRKHANGTPYFSERETASKWAGFDNKRLDAVSSGTIVQMAQEHGWSPAGVVDAAFDWDSEISLIDPTWADETTPEDEVSDKSPKQMLADYLAAVFDSEEKVGYVCTSWKTEDGRRVPTKGCFDRTAGQLRQELISAQDLGAVLGDWDEKTGAWIRFNPLDGKGVGNSNVVEYRHALVESDSLAYEKQLPMIRAMNLPCAAIVSSGGKSVHAIVKIDAGTDYGLYRKRVEELYSYCRKHGFEPDTQNKNPSRLSRLPGATRNGKIQTLIDVNVGAENWDAWIFWRDEQEDDLPETVGAEKYLESLPPLAPVLIGTEERGLLRRGHKGMLVGPSKAGKSFAMVELALAVASGGEWLGWSCKRGRVLYCNLEIDSASFAHRLIDVAKRKHIDSWAHNVDVLNLRGRIVTLDKLAPSIIKRCRRDKRQDGYSLVIVDPIYKTLTGDENNASDMAKFMSLLDQVTAETGASVFACHHHSKGMQGQKHAMDRAAGSGVFSRDLDALLDMAPLDVPKDKQDLLNDATAWRLSATLREFATPEPMDILFAYPIHLPEDTGATREWKVEGEDPFAKRREAQKEAAKARRESLRDEAAKLMRDAFEECRENGNINSAGEVQKKFLMAVIGEREESGTKPSDRTVKDWASKDWCPIGCRKGDSVNVNGKHYIATVFYDKDAERDREWYEED